MTYVWTKPDETRQQVSSADTIKEVLDAIMSKWAAARERGDRLAQASLRASYSFQQMEWQRCQRAIFHKEVAGVDEMIELVTTRGAWWNECAQPVPPPSQLSPAQNAIFAKCDEDARPRSWKQAAFALRQLPEFCPPEPGRTEEALRANGELLLKAKAFRNALVRMVETLDQFVPAQAEWDEFQQLASEYEQAVRDAALA